MSGTGQKEKPGLEDSTQRRVDRLRNSANLAPEQKPDGMSVKSWQVILAAVNYIHQLEDLYLDELITRHVVAIIRAERCKCPQCVRKARFLSQELEDELTRQEAIFGTNSFHDEEKPLIENAISLAIHRIWEKKGEKQAEAQDKRWEKLRNLLQKVRKDSAENQEEHTALSPDDELIKQQLLREIRALREKRRQNRK